MPVGEAPNLSHPLRRALGAVLASWLLIATAVAQEPPPAAPAPSPPAPARSATGVFGDAAARARSGPASHNEFGRE